MLGQPAECAGPGAHGSSPAHDTSYYLKCMVGGLFGCGLTHTAVCPLDIVKCNMQANPGKYKSMKMSYQALVAESGMSWVKLGWLPTLIGYSFQGLAKFGFYEIFKDIYGGAVSPENAVAYRSLIWACASASAEFFADILLCPFEAVKVRIQTSPKGTFPDTFGPGWEKIKSTEGINGFYKGITPLWCRQIPYTIMKFVVFEKVVAVIFEDILHKRRDEVGKAFNLSMTFLAGYIAGVVCALVSHPADTLFTAYNKKKTEGGSFGQEIGKLYKEMPQGALWKGLVPRIFMIGTLTGLQWWIYDSWKTYCGLKPTGS
jgi:solute carrier family 25 phosphate transporter 3